MDKEISNAIKELKEIRARLEEPIDVLAEAEHRLRFNSFIYCDKCPHAKDCPEKYKRDKETTDDRTERSD